MWNLVIYCHPVETSYHASLHQEVLTLHQQPPHVYTLEDGNSLRII